MCRKVTVAVCVCVCVSGSILPNSNESAKKTYKSSQHCNCLIYNVEFFLKQPLCEVTESKWQQYWRTCWPFCLPLQVPECISIHMALLSATLCFLQALPLCLARHYIVHVRIYVTGRCPRPRAIVCLKEDILPCTNFDLLPPLNIDLYNF